MGLFGLKIVKEKKQNHYFDDEDRKLSAEMRAAKQQYMRSEWEHKIKMLELETALQEAKTRASISDMLPEGEEGDTMAMTMFQPIIEKFLQGAMNKPTPPTSLVNTSAPARTPLTDEEIREYKSTISSSMLKRARTMPDAIIKGYCLNEIPDLTDEEFSRVLLILRE